MNSASSSKEAAQLLPQKRRTLSSGFSQYQHEPFAGRLARDGIPGVATATAASTGSAASPLSGKLSCVVSKIYPPTRQTEVQPRLLQRNIMPMRNLKRGPWRNRATAVQCNSTPFQCAPNGLALQSLHADSACEQHPAKRPAFHLANNSPSGIRARKNNNVLPIFCTHAKSCVAGIRLCAISLVPALPANQNVWFRSGLG